MEEITNKIADYKTDERDLKEVLNNYDFDEALEFEGEQLHQRLTALQIRYQALLNTRRFYIDG